MDDVNRNRNINMFKLQIYLIASNARDYHYFDYPCIVNDETQHLMEKHNLIIHKNFLTHKHNLSKLNLDLTNNIIIGNLLGYKNSTHYDENVRRLDCGIPFKLNNIILFSIFCDNLVPYTEIGLIDHDNFDIDIMIKHLEYLETKWHNVLHNYGFKNVEYKIHYNKIPYETNNIYKYLVDKVPISKRFCLQL